MKFGVGQPVRRFEDLSLITGRGHYTDDIHLPGMALAYVLRSPQAHAAIRSLDAAAARGMPGVLLVLTGTDVNAEGLGDVPCLSPLRIATARPRTRRRGRSWRRPRCATSASRSPWWSPRRSPRRATPPRRSSSTTRHLPAVADARAAIEPGAPQLFDGIPGNLVFDWDNDTSDFAATDAAFASAARVTTLELVNNRVVANSMEPRNAIGAWDAASGRPALYTATQGSAFRARSASREVLKLPKEKVR